MAFASSKTSNAQNVLRLPTVARKLIEKDRERQVKANIGGEFRGRLEKTLRYLRWKSECNTLFDAAGYIAAELERENLYALYQKLFPKEWKNSGASFQRTGYSEYHTEREFEFIELVSDRYFPLCTWLDWSDFRFDHIPIEPVNFDLCCGEYEWQEFRPCLQFGIAAFLWRNTDDEDWREILAGFKVPFEALPPIENAAPPYAALDAGREDPKIRRFLHLIEFIFHDTGNPFIDTTYCQPVDLYEWTLENLEMLKSRYKAVNEYFASMVSIEEDIERDALATFEELIGLWNTGRLPAKRRQIGRYKQAEKTDDSRGLLINILADSELNHAETAFNF